MGKTSELASHLDGEGRLLRFPARSAARQAALLYLAEKFLPGACYGEREVNELIGRWHVFEDPCLLRRALVEGGFLKRKRDGSAYWRELPGGEKERDGVSEAAGAAPVLKKPVWALRPVRPEDAAVLAEIYAPYVKNTAVSFEYTPPDAAEFARRIEEKTAIYPYLVCVEGERPVGYAYASRAQERAAYGWNAEVSIYVREDYRRSGIGRALYTALLEILRQQQVQTVYAVITSPNEPSERFHERMGFVRFACFPKAGYKLGRWRDVIWMQKDLGGHEVPPLPIIPVTGLAPHAVDEAIARGTEMLLSCGILEGEE